MTKTLSRLVRILAAPVLVACAGSVAAQIAENPVGRPFYGDAPDETHPWAVHDRNRPQPPVVTPGSTPGAAPSDATILFDGTETSFAENWMLADEKRRAEGKNWVLRDGAMESVKGAGYIRTKAEFGDCQLHVEWAAPTKIEGESQGRGNSGVFLPGGSEVQVLDNFNNPSYPDGMAGCVYGVAPPMVNSLRPPGEFQSYDIIYRRPVFRDGVQVAEGRMTVLINGVVVQANTPIEGGGGHRGRSKAKAFPETGPIKFQDHGNPVRFRNVWIRPLPARSIEGGELGILTAEATAEKRASIAEAIRADAAGLADGEGTDSLPKLMRAMESLIYADDAETRGLVDQLSARYLDSVAALKPEKAESHKAEILQFKGALDYMEKFGHLSGDHPAKGKVQSIIQANGWNKKK